MDLEPITVRDIRNGRLAGGDARPATAAGYSGVPASASRPVAPRLDQALLDRIAARAPAADRGGCDLSADIADLERAGLLRAPLPACAGGAGWGAEPSGAQPLFEALRGLGRANLSVARLFEGHVNAAKLVLLHGSHGQRAALALDLQAGCLLGMWGADGPRPLTIADGGSRLDGGKAFASGLGVVSRAVVTAPTARGLQMLLVPTDEPARSDASCWRMSGMRATASGHYDFTGLALEQDHLLGRPDAYLREPYFEGGVWRYCAAHLGGAEALVRVMRGQLVRQGRDRDPHQERRVAEASRACETARLWTLEAAGRVEAGGLDEERGRGAAAYALLARETTEEACRLVIDIVDHALGVGSFAEHHPAERIRRDLAVYLRQAAPDGKRTVAARALLQRDCLPEAL